jgi:hypothetical protein
MDSEEREIFQFLKSRGSDFVNGAEIARRAGGKKKFHDDPAWAKPILARMQERGLLEHNALGQYRIKPVGKKSKGNRWVAPDIAKILEESGVQIDSAGGETATDEYYEGL